MFTFHKMNRTKGITFAWIYTCTQSHASRSRFTYTRIKYSDAIIEIESVRYEIRCNLYTSWIAQRKRCYISFGILSVERLKLVRGASKRLEIYWCKAAHFNKSCLKISINRCCSSCSIAHVLNCLLTNLFHALAFDCINTHYLRVFPSLFLSIIKQMDLTEFLIFCLFVCIRISSGWFMQRFRRAKNQTYDLVWK